MESLKRIRNDHVQAQLDTLEQGNLSPEECHSKKAAILKQALLTELIRVSEAHAALAQSKNQAMQLRSGRMKSQNEQKGDTDNLDSCLAKVTELKKIAEEKVVIVLPPTTPVELFLFPFYWDLPPEMRLSVLDQITSPVDKLNVAEAYPGEALLARWNLDALRFRTVVYPRLLDMGNWHWLDWETIEMLRETGPDFRKTINETFYQHMQGTGKHLINETCHSLDVILSIPPAKRWSSMSPITSPVCVGLGNGNPVGNDMNKLHRLSEWAGPRIWHCEFKYCPQVTPEPLHQAVCRTLAMMPNLVKLIIFEEAGVWGAGQVLNQEMDTLELPPLPSLKTLLISGDCSSAAMLLRQKLYQSYAPQLINFVTEYDSSNVDFADFNDNMPAFPKLSAWVCGHLQCTNGWLLHRKMLQQLMASPLKVVVLWVNPASASKPGFALLLELLGTHFGGTLEELEIMLEDSRADVVISGAPIQWTNALVNLSFPRLKHFIANVSQFPGGWDFLILFPALEKITFNDLATGAQIEQQENVVTILELSANVRSLINSNVWKLLPVLNEVTTGESRFGNDLAPVPPTKITRKECIVAAAK